MSVNLSHSKVELYKLCPRKYKYQCVDKLEAETQSSPLLFGIAIDNALNYILECKKDNKQIDVDKAKKLFQSFMNLWDKKEDLIFFKSEIPEEDFVEDDDKGNQERAWSNLCKIGPMMIDAYVEDILPRLKSVKAIQVRRKVENNEGDYFRLVIDLIAEINDGRTVVFDNKTASRKYPKTAVKKSVQLATYTEFEDTVYAGYIVLVKKPKDGKIVIQFMVDEVPEELTNQVFNDIALVTQKIKDGDFRKNTKACWVYGKQCEYYNLCFNGKMDGLRKRK
jgi:hypothetical protein